MQIIQGFQIDAEVYKQEIVNEVINAIKNGLASPESKDLLTSKQTAEFLSLSLSGVNQYCNQGYLKAYFIGSSKFFKKSEILENLVAMKIKL